MRAKRIKRITISSVSLCPRGKNTLPVVYKDDNSIVFNCQVRAVEKFDEQGELVAVVYAPNLVDKDGHFADADVVKEAAYSHMKNGAKLDIRHDGKAIAKEKAFVAESFIIQKGDERFQGWKDYDGKEVDVSGGWGIVVKIDDPDLRKSYREDGWNGVSLAGHAELIDDEPPASWLSRLRNEFRDWFLSTHKGDDDVADLKDLTEVVKEMAKGQAELTKAMTSFIEAQSKKTETTNKEETKKEEKRPAFKGDARRKADVKKYIQQLTSKKLEDMTIEELNDYYKELEDEPEPDPSYDFFNRASDKSVAKEAKSKSGSDGVDLYVLGEQIGKAFAGKE